MSTIGVPSILEVSHVDAEVFDGEDRDDVEAERVRPVGERVTNTPCSGLP